MKIKLGELKRILREARGTKKHIPLTWEQVQQEFPEAAAKALEDHAENVRLMKQDGEWDEDWDGDEDGEGPGILPPEQCKFWLEKDSPWGDLNSLPKYPGYVLHMYDEEAVASYHGGGSDMMWTGEEWEM